MSSTNKLVDGSQQKLNSTGYMKIYDVKRLVKVRKYDGHVEKYDTLAVTIISCTCMTFKPDY